MDEHKDVGRKPKIAALSLLLLLLGVGICVSIGFAVNTRSRKSETSVELAKVQEMYVHLVEQSRKGRLHKKYMWDDTLGDMSESEYETFKMNVIKDLATQDNGLEDLSLKEKYMNSMQFDKEILFRHKPGPCRRVPGADGGSEDIAILDNGMMLISSGWMPNSRARILMYDFNDPMANVTELQIQKGTDSNLAMNSFPHGLATWTENGVIYVYVLHHPTLEDSVEMFEFDPVTKILHHIRNFTSPDFRYMNNLVLIGKEKFYITKFWRYRDYARWNTEIHLLANFGEIVLYDGTKPPEEAATTLITGLIMPNGINLSPDKQYLYVAETGTTSLRIYKRDLDDNSLEEYQVVNTGTGLDNIEIDPDTGDIWIGAHPIGHLIWKYIHNGAQTLSPSQVLQIKVINGTVVDMIEVYLDHGKEISASTSASIFNNTVVIGALGDDVILVCDRQTTN